LKGVLPLGVIGRTVTLKGEKRATLANLVCLSELTQHQLAIAILASGGGRETFYARLFHDVYKNSGLASGKVVYRLTRRGSTQMGPSHRTARGLPEPVKPASLVEGETGYT